jgi:hypothetical protein
VPEISEARAAEPLELRVSVRTIAEGFPVKSRLQISEAPAGEPLELRVSVRTIAEGFPVK